MNFISPLTLLIVPLLGSLIILFYPRSYSEGAEVQKNYAPFSASPGNSSTNFDVGQGNTFRTFNKLVGMAAIEKNTSNLKKIALITSLINFGISIIL